jgi:GTPase Era involved in 16S rRNA processing
MPREILIVGRTGVGKSSFVNATFGIRLAPVSAYEACTKLVTHYAYGTLFGNVCLIDTPGLAEDTEQRDRQYLSLIRRHVDFDRLDVVLYVTNLDETRFRPEEKHSLRLLTECLGAGVWRKGWLVLSFAASVGADQRNQRAQQRISSINDYLHCITAHLYPRFSGFPRVALVDNEVENWCLGGEPIARWLTK